VHLRQGTHNNYSEQQIKHFATGRKAWLFSYDASSAQASANLFSLVMTCRVNDIEPYAYLNYLFEGQQRLDLLDRAGRRQMASAASPILNP
jgi:hypothetical protein